MLNVGKMRISGAELEAAWTPIEGLLLDSQIGYLDADYKEFEDDQFPADDSRAFQTPAFAPEWTLRFGAQYGFDLGNAGSVTIGGSIAVQVTHGAGCRQYVIIYRASGARRSARPTDRGPVPAGLLAV